MRLHVPDEEAAIIQSEHQPAPVARGEGAVPGAHAERVRGFDLRLILDCVLIGAGAAFGAEVLLGGVALALREELAGGEVPDERAGVRARCDVIGMLADLEADLLALLARPDQLAL